MTETTTYEVRGPYVTRGFSQWYVWERTSLGVPQLLSTHDTEEEAKLAAVCWEQEA